MNQSDPSNFALTGAAGYIAPRHFKAIKETGNQLAAATDPHDSVGILDSYFPNCAFFTEYERFDRHLEKLRRRDETERVHFLSVCSPNYLHDAHVRTALRIGASAICEKPLVLNPWNLDALREMEEETGARVWTVLQLRVHPALASLRDRLAAETNATKHSVELTYVTSRGRWYLQSWKGAVERSGGLATNIGVHLFDLLAWMFGDVERCDVHVSTPTVCAGFLELERARVKWFLSVDIEHVPTSVRSQEKRTFRSISLDGQEIEFSDGFADLHTEVYRRTLQGQGFGIDAARKAIEMVHRIRRATPLGVGVESHRMLRSGAA